VKTLKSFQTHAVSGIIDPRWQVTCGMFANVVVVQEVNKQITFRLSDVELQLSKSDGQIKQQHDRLVIVICIACVATVAVLTKRCTVTNFYRA